MTSPTIIVLYDSDAVEVRYSDESRLELSPCGATMIYYPPPKKDEHPRQGLASRVTKRTCFVTSDHKKFVLQALDFRNRFAQRPYLCEELLQKENILTLYAFVDAIRWPDSIENAHVEIQGDGSRKVTSLDDFASLVVSPHGQDFSISYLSRISLDEKNKDVSSQLSLPSLSHFLSRDSSQCIGQKTIAKNNEAIVKPFSHEIQNSSDQMQCLIKENDKAIFDHMDIESNKYTEVEQMNKSSDVEIDETLVEQSTPRSGKGETENLSNIEHTEVICFDDRAISSNVINSINSNHDEKQVGNIIPGSPIAHDISSISRSSTPDGLRTTIDSDATLINDNNELEGLPVHKASNKYHRHSSPTHTSSPFDIKQLLIMNNGRSNQPQNLDGSYLESERHPPIGKEYNESENGNSKIEDKSKEICPAKIQNTSNHFEINPLILSNALVHLNNLHDSQEIAVPKNIMQTQGTIVSIDTHQHSSVIHKDMAEGAVLSGQRFVDTEQSGHNMCYSSSDYSGMHFPNDPKFKFQHEKLEFDTRISADVRLAKNAQHSPRPLSSVCETEDEKEAACRKKYTWVTCHSSRNGCPKEWTHPLMLALRGKTLIKHQNPQTESIKTEEKYKRFSVPKPLPLTCPFQHTHRISNNQSSDDCGNRNEDSALRMGEFQQGRMKVVLSEGIIYRLIPSNDMTLVEIYPGDGTVLVSQGVKAIFFTHFIPRVDVLEERTYSLKSLPPGCAKGRHSIEKMMKTANRLVQICINWDKRSGKWKSPCWQKEVIAVVEPLSSSLLEECSVDGLGRFSAFTNGRVRILFDDRTSLDTMADFTPRLGSTHAVHGNMLYSKNAWGDTARLLITSGKYVTVDVNRPGQYIKYLSATKEWISWVNASPAERHEFYRQQNQPQVLQQAAELELKKIFCFNYVLEHSAIPNLKTTSGPAVNEAQIPVFSVDPYNYPPTTALSHLAISKPTNPQLTFPQTSRQSNPNPASDHPYILPIRSSVFISPSVHPSSQYNPLSSTPRQPYVYPKDIPASHQSPLDDKCVSTAMGFQSVRSALARTSSLINDIEMFLEESKT